MRRMLSLTAVIGLCMSVPAAAGPEEDFEGLFGDEARKVQASADKKDDATFAARLLKAADALADSPQSQVLLYRKAYEFGVTSPAGSGTAVAAAERLETLAPDAGPWGQMRLKALRVLYDGSGGPAKRRVGMAYLRALTDEADAALEAGKTDPARQLYTQALQIATFLRAPQVERLVAQIREADRAGKEARQLKAELAELVKKLMADPRDAEARTEAVHFCMIRLNDPAKAKTLLHTSVDETLRRRVTLAAGRPDEIGEPPALLDLGRWYLGTLAPAAPAYGRMPLLERALGYFNRFLDVYPRRDVSRVRAILLLEKTEEALREGAGHDRFGLPKGAVLVLTFDTGSILARDGRAYVRDLSGHGRDAPTENPRLVRGRAGMALKIERGRGGPTLPKLGPMKLCTVAFWARLQNVPRLMSAPLITPARQEPGTVDARIGARDGSLRFFLWLHSARLFPSSFRAPGGQVDRWVHLAVAFDTPAQKAHVYIDGKRIAAATIERLGEGQPIKAVDLSDAGLGRHMGKLGRGPGLTGLLDELVVFDRLLSDAEVRHVHALGARGVSLVVARKPAADEPPKKEPGKEPDPDTKVVRVEANKMWNPAGAYKAGQVLELKATGIWRIQAQRGSCTADGRPFDWSKGEVVGHLRGRFSGGEPFKIGTRHTFKAPKDGILELGIADSDDADRYKDNSGALKVTIQVRK